MFAYLSGVNIESQQDGHDEFEKLIYMKVKVLMSFFQMKENTLTETFNKIMI